MPLALDNGATELSLGKLKNNS